MDESGEHHSQQTDARTENQTPNVLTHKWVLTSENTWTQERQHHTPGPEGWGDRGGIMGCGGIVGKESPKRKERTIQNKHFYFF